MVAILDKKFAFINALTISHNQEINDFIGHFYKDVSLGYLQHLEGQYSKDLLIEIAEHAFEICKRTPPQDNFHIVFYEFANKNVLFLHFINKPFAIRSLNVWLDANKLNVNEFINTVFTPKRNSYGNFEESIIAIVLPKSVHLPENYKKSLHALYQQLTLVLDDYLPMQMEINRVSDNLLSQNNESIQQAGELIKWLENKNFALLGLRYFEAGFQHDKKRLGAFKLSEFDQYLEFSPQILKKGETIESLQNHAIQIKKVNKRSDLYRGSRLDSIEILDIDQGGVIKGIVQIIGLFTSNFYKTSPLDIAGLQNKVEKIYQHFGFLEQSYNGKILKKVINSIPLDEFYYIPLDDLTELIARILNMYNRIAVFARYNAVANSVSVLIYLPKHRYSENLRQEFSMHLLKEFGGIITSTNASVGDASFARLVYIINCESFCNTQINVEDLEEKLWVASQSWQEQLHYFCQKINISSDVKFSDLYISFNEPEVAVKDVKILENWLNSEEEIYLGVVRKENKVFVRIFQRNQPLTLGQIIPIFSNFQLHIQSEITFSAKFNDHTIWMHSYEIANLNESIAEQTINKLIDGLKAAWTKIIEIDPYNALTIACDLDFNEIIIFRALGRFLKQLGFNYSQKSLAECLSAYPEITQSLIGYFKQKFSLSEQSKAKDTLDNLYEKVVNSLNVIERLDHDRIMRRFFNIIVAMVRTNAYQSGEFKPYPCVSFKVNSTQIIDIPQPSPLFEIFVYSPMVEGCHLRGGTIARGGIRWSDRPEDFRFETLGLMKAQMVKNSVIVPVGSKGGFFVKNYSALQETGASKQQLQEAVVTAYQNFIGQLLTLTDNFVSKKIVSPVNVVKYDNDDPYLVVAADKGTATFSDIANQISNDVGFWLGDAFASGGSKGYDHKKLAITARGAWIAVRRHFWELGIDCQTAPINVVGVGDMSGDVFGNAMLQSTKINLIAAFNHKHIFLDPNPEPEQSYKERERLFNLPGSNWTDYDRNIISKGGGVFERSAKSIEISTEVAKVLNISKGYLSPDELISKILTCQTDLLFFGGIGTFIKGQHESDAQVADRTNDSIRVCGKMLKAKVVAEGANLGVTQLGRIEYALNGGRINTDAIDNSAGVDCSDHEVNLKIMSQVLLEQNLLDNHKRDELLKDLAVEVSELVLEDNWAQTLILTIMQEESNHDLNAYINLIKNLEKRDSLPLRPGIEYIPTDEELQQRKNQNLGITRPELAVLLAYSKIHLYQDLLHALQNTACFGETYYLKYFPKHFQENYKNQLSYHPLKVEITATVLSNLIINIMGPCFVGQMSKAFRVDPLQVVQAFVEVLEQTNMFEKIQKYLRLQSDVGVTLSSLRNIARNLSQCMMARLSNESKLFTNTVIDSDHVPFSVIFTTQIFAVKTMDLALIEKNYQTLDLAYLWHWAEQIQPIASWQTASWLLLQHDLIKVISWLCQRTWNEERLENYWALYEQLKNHIACLPDTSQDLLLLDYVIRQLGTLKI